MKVALIIALLFSGRHLAEVVNVNGSAEVIRAGKGPVIKAETGIMLFPCDVIKTKDGVVEIKYPDGSKIIVYQNTTLEIDEKALVKESTLSKVFKIIRIGIGRIKALFTKIKNGENSAGIVSPSSVIGVRGTEFTAFVASDGSTAIEVKEGEVDLNAGELTVKAGYRAIFDIEKGLKYEPLAFPFHWEEWMMKKREMIEKRQRELLEKINEIMEKKLKRYEAYIDALQRRENEEVARDYLTRAFMLDENLSAAIKIYRSRGMELRIERKITRVRNRYRRILRMVEERFMRERQKAEEKVRMKREKIERRFKKFEEESK